MASSGVYKMAVMKLWHDSKGKQIRNILKIFMMIYFDRMGTLHAKHDYFYSPNIG
jgi:hypothetical protein